MFWRNLSISRKLFLAISLAGLLIVVVMAGLIGWSIRSGFSQYLAETEIGRFDRLVEGLEDAWNPGNPDWPELQAGQAAWNDFTRQFIPRGGPRPPRRGERPQRPRNFDGSDGSRENRRPDRRRPQDPLQLGQRLVLLDDKERWISGSRRTGDVAAKRPIIVIGPDGNRTTVGWLALTAPQNRSAASDTIFLRGQLNNIALAAAIALALAALFAWFLARQFNQPIQQLATGVGRLTRHDYSHRMENDRGDEIGQLIEDFNQLADALEKQEKRERQWLSDTSHELQTPVAVLRAGIEAIQDGIRKPDSRNLEELHKSVMDLSRLIEDVRTLSLGGENRLVGEFGPVDLNDLLEDCVEAFEPIFAKEVLKLEFISEGPAHILGDRNRLRQVMDNLLENSRRYTDSPGETQILLQAKAGEIRITAEDSSPAPSPESLPRLFERFFRVEESRSRKHGGSGLGLSICRTIIEAHGGTIDAKQSELGGLRIEISLPNGDVNA